MPNMQIKTTRNARKTKPINESETDLAKRVEIHTVQLWHKEKVMSPEVGL